MLRKFHAPDLMHQLALQSLGPDWLPAGCQLQTTAQLDKHWVPLKYAFSAATADDLAHPANDRQKYQIA